MATRGWALAASLAALVASASALADDASPGVTIEASIGVMQGEANEFVYRLDGSTISQLVWAFDNIAVFNGGIAVSPLAWLSLGARFRIALSDQSTMDDYDWLFPDENDSDCP